MRETVGHCYARKAIAMDSSLTPGPGGGTRSLPAAHHDLYRALRHFPLFDGIGNDDLASAIGAGEIELRSFWRDEIVSDPVAMAAEGPRVFLVKSGYAVLALFDQNVLERERGLGQRTRTPKEKRRKVRSHGPMIRLAEKNLATFGEGELFNSEALGGIESARMAFYSSRPTELIAMAPARVSQLAATYPFFAERLKRAVEISRDRMAGIEGVKQEIFDFFVRHGLSVAETLRVRQVERCIECKECEIACEERYGHKRLSIFGPRLGMLDFIYTCRTCEDQRCIDPCNYDSIKFDTDKGEVVINDNTCTGCAACAVACPYGAIEMVPLDDPNNKLLKLRLEKKGALAHGKGAGRVAKLEKIASKCDHCIDYADQACVSHCPTGALIELRPTDIFRDQQEIAEEAAKTGYERTGAVAIEDMLPVEQFKKGLGITDFGNSKVPRQKLSPAIIWGLGLGAFFLALAEIILRTWYPTLSLQYLMLVADGLEPAIARAKVTFRAGGDFAVYLGFVGTGLMAVAMLYPLRKKSKFLQRLSTSASWFDFHLMGGIVGPMFIVLHSAMRLDNWVSSAFWSMVIIVVSGFVGRYVMVQMPAAIGAKDLTELELERKLAHLRGAYPRMVAVADMELDRFRSRIDRQAKGAGALTALFLILADDFSRPVKWVRRSLALRDARIPASARRQVVGITGRLRVAHRRSALLPAVHSLVTTWKRVHVWFTWIAAVLIAIHIVVALIYSM